MYRQFADTLVLTRDAECFLLNLLPDFLEVRETFVDVEELTPLSVGGCGYRGRGFWSRCVDKLENEWSTGDNALASREKITTDDPVDPQPRQLTLLCTS